jgi:hypothetical protein
MAAICMLGISALVPAQEKAPDVVVLKGNPMGGVKFNHTNHAKLVGDKCDTCHHASKPEKAAKSAHENCQNCHTKAATAPMKTNAKAAFHDAMAKAGTCATCHAKQAAAGKKPPLKCPECHKEKG